MKNFTCISVNHKLCGQAFRSLFTFDSAQCEKLLFDVKDLSPVLICTCNRTELYSPFINHLLQHTSHTIPHVSSHRSDMLPGNGGIPFRTTDLGFCSDSSEVIFTFSLLAPVSHHHRLALPFCGKVTLFVNAFLIYRYYISHFFALSSRML